MNGRSQSPTDSQNSSPTLSRREKRKLEPSNGRRKAENSDKHATFNAAGTIPRDAIVRITNLVQFLGSYNDDVDKIEHALDRLMEKDEKIKSLSSAIQELKHSNNEELQGLKEEIEENSNRLIELEQRELTMIDNQQRFEAEKKQEKERRKQFDKEQQTKYERKLDAEKDRLSQVNALRTEKAQVEKTLGLYVKNVTELESQLKESESRHPIQSLSTEHYENAFSNLREKIRAITQTYLCNLPPENELDIDEVQKEFTKLQSIFGTISLSASVASRFLRVRGAQCIIVEAICSCFWQPFYVTARSLTSEAVAPLSQISNKLFEEDRYKESLWRNLTFKGLDMPTSSQDRCQVRPEVKRIAEILQRLIPKQKHKDFEIDLEELLLESIRIWDELKRDSCVVAFDLQPPSVWSPGWKAEDCPDLGLADVEANSEPGNISKMKPWCLFPRVIFHTIDGRKKFFPGNAIFANSPAFHENCAEIQRQEEEIAQIKKNFVRRPTISRGTRGLATE
ncbi:uncharacterized protein TRUGW13939_08843 [Talaromyces rugulosus]|uniref:Uncharacterized protein n=1 Tax=Talaromyces rugulosus TaxID=121627 RepID=A0A7H8R6V0_TALRU|nr:uncharacterized protein TRUGW13939_08843 [Talaromyces rugulosus]QKX61688.1 hypothetical protein TRUGW13939_08843 [Talaromyces rugulosus]